MAQQVDASVEAVQQTAPDPLPDRRVGETAVEQLRPSDRAALTARDPHGTPVGVRGHFWALYADKCPRFVREVGRG